jgi:hypothetical protein
MKTEIHSKEWFDEAFTDPVTLNPIQIPASIRKLSERIVKSYNIQGICDPMYIVNVIAVELGLGDGMSNFNKSEKETTK